MFVTILFDPKQFWLKFYLSMSVTILFDHKQWTYSVTFATDIERGNVTFKDLSNRESGSRFPMKNCSLRSRFFFFFNNCSTIFHWETAPRFAVRKIFERDIATFNVAGKSN